MVVNRMEGIIVVVDLDSMEIVIFVVSMAISKILVSIIQQVLLISQIEYHQIMLNSIFNKRNHLMEIVITAKDDKQINQLVKPNYNLNLIEILIIFRWMKMEVSLH